MNKLRNNLTIALATDAFLCIGLISACSKVDDTMVTPTTPVSDYTGTASVTQGLASTTITNLYPAGQRVAGLGTITATDASVWTMPAEVNYMNGSFPTAQDLYNPDGKQYASAAAALATFDTENVVEIDADGALFTAYILPTTTSSCTSTGPPWPKTRFPLRSSTPTS